MTDVVRTYVPAESVEEQWDLPGLEQALARRMAARRCRSPPRSRRATRSTDDDIVEQVVQAADAPFDGQGRARRHRAVHAASMRIVLLQSLDTHWREHLAALDYLRQGIHLRGYAQKNPKQEYKREAFELFGADARLGQARSDARS